ncbi:MAG: energy transducer TonB [Bacteroidia bacterium]|nr:energy transducer TonB [Bacteroidia bacterium]
MSLIPVEILRLEQKNIRISAIATTLIMLLLALVTFFFTAYRTPDRPPGKEYKFVGAIDFGDNKQGSQKVNTLDRSVADPKPTPPAQAQPQSQPNPVPPAATPPPQVTTPAPKPVSTPSTPAKPTPKPTPTPTQPTQSKPATPQTTTPAPTPNQSQELDPNFSMNAGGGANQGNADPGAVGNSGTPNTTILDPNGMYSFGEGGGGGLDGRGVVAIPYPNYNAQEEGILSFEFIIAPNGSVVYAKALPNNKPALAKLGEDAIKKWKFDPVPGSSNQKVRVKMTFKLR